MLSLPIYYTLYLIAGMALKLGDDLLDDLNRPKLAWFPLLVAGTSFGILMTQTEWDLALFLAIIVGVLVSGKVNRPQFFVGFIVIGVILWVCGPAYIPVPLEWGAVFLALIIASAIDEFGNDRFESSQNEVMSVFFKYRFSLKLVALIIGCIRWGFIQTMIGLWIFDLSYEVMGRLVRTVIAHADRQDYSRHR